MRTPDQPRSERGIHVVRMTGKPVRQCLTVSPGDLKVSFAHKMATLIRGLKHFLMLRHVAFASAGKVVAAEPFIFLPEVRFGVPYERIQCIWNFAVGSREQGVNALHEFAVSFVDLPMAKEVAVGPGEMLRCIHRSCPVVFRLEEKGAQWRCVAEHACAASLLVKVEECLV